MSTGAGGASPGFGVGSQVPHSQTHPSSHGSSHPSTTHTLTRQPPIVLPLPNPSATTNPNANRSLRTRRMEAVFGFSDFVFSHGCLFACLPVDGQGGVAVKGVKGDKGARRGAQMRVERMRVK